MDTIRLQVGALSLGMLLAVPGAVAQQDPYPPSPPSYQAAPVASGSLNWMPQGMAALGQQASSHTDFTFDRSMLALAGSLYGLDEQTRQTVARLNGIAVHLYHFPAPGAYDHAAVDAVRAQYGVLGWKHLATTNTRTGTPVDTGGRTDVWLDSHGINIAGAAILLSGQTSVNLIVVSGDLSTLDLLHLRGHFGIPRFPDDALGH